MPSFVFSEEGEAIRAERALVPGRFGENKLRAVVRHHLLVKRDDVMTTPHIASTSREAVKRIRTTTREHRGVS